MRLRVSCQLLLLRLVLVLSLWLFLLGFLGVSEFFVLVLLAFLGCLSAGKFYLVFVM